MTVERLHRLIQEQSDRLRQVEQGEQKIPGTSASMLRRVE